MKLIKIGKILSAHGVAGAVKIESYAEDPGNIFQYKPLYINVDKQEKAELIIKELKPLSDTIFLATIKGVTDRSQTESIRQKEIFVERNQLPPVEDDSFYFNDLINVKVEDDEGQDVGVIKEVLDYGAGPFAEIITADEKSITAFLNKSSIVSIDNEKIVIKSNYIIK